MVFRTGKRKYQFRKGEYDKRFFTEKDLELLKCFKSNLNKHLTLKETAIITLENSRTQESINQFEVLTNKIKRQEEYILFLEGQLELHQRYFNKIKPEFIL